MHGGLSPELSSIDLIRSIQRPCDVPDKGLLCDLLWSDPERELLSGWGINDRGVSYTFAEDVVHDFLQQHDLDLVCRAHQVMEDGYEFFADRNLVTIFSAPNYCGEFDNAGGMMSVDEDLMCSFQVESLSVLNDRFSDLLIVNRNTQLERILGLYNVCILVYHKEKRLDMRPVLWLWNNHSMINVSSNFNAST